VFGYGGVPEWGMAGAAWATVVAFWFKTAVYFALMLRPRERQTYKIFEGCRLDWPLLKRLVTFGYPNGVQLLLDAGGFTLFLFLVGRLGARELTATNVAFNINNIAFMPIWGLGIATTTLVGQRLGQDRADLAARATWSTFGIAMVYSAIIGSAYLLAPDLFLRGFDNDADPEKFAALRPVIITLLWFVATYLTFDAMNVVFCSAIKGAGDTRFVLYTSSTLSIVMVGVTWFALEVCGLGLNWAFSIMIFWLVGLGGSYFARFRQGKWRRMRVIETTYLPGVH
jgi:MATE family multidrug resistance protein